MLKDKDFVYIDYIGKVKDTGEVFDTTIEEEAKKANIYNKETKYAPKLVILGEHNVIQGLEEALYQMNPGEEKEIEIPPEKAYGPRDNTKVKTISLGELRRQGINPYPNMVVRLSNGSLAVVKSVSGGRVILDLNHPLAGKTLVYKVKVVKVLENESDKIKALIERWLGSSYVDKLNMELDEKKNVKFTLPKELYLVEDIQIRKYMLAKDIINYVLPESTVTYIENYNKEVFSQ
ncbi:peptidylprolyl isomerase [Sulfurisphaera tokodaii]|uniref:Peptidyl-prolyl cis-trans isomerase n=2 Tax=Sulfurisphaera tokodaii TaxID=111955 RepID=Q975S7_SULTO|nr:peptidylprolyl isomerase [Sulfurisphaera tokodaii]BAB65323.1 FKBP-type peptidyl-prolyl cis-trans isomerase [Sulfurisphaera tokodaii str. 7]HII74979.1 peptidylprolyl isomerase [Sulfurisphaera tokodaii]